MSQPRPTGFNPLPFIVAGIVLMMGILLIGVAAWALLGGGMRTAEATSTPRPVRTISIPTAAPTVATATPTLAPTLPATSGATAIAPANAPTATQAPPTAVPPTNRPAATNPPAATPTPTATPTSTVTATSTATPTNVATATATQTNRIINPGFSVESAVVPANQAIWFNFSVTNASPSAELHYGYLGAAVYKDGSRIHFQGSYSSASLLPGQTLNWRDHTEIGTPGVYQLQLSICYSPKDSCTWPNGEWELLAQPVTVTIQ